MTVHFSGFGSVHTEYFPAGSSRPSNITFVETSIVVASSAHGHQIRPYGTSFPKSSRPRATGRLYSTVMVVSAMCCDTLPCWLGFIFGSCCAKTPQVIESAATTANLQLPIPNGTDSNSRSGTRRGSADAPQLPHGSFG